ncbi:GNAT family N-acetyltransferase [Fretibacter rubidus]|uniref:GNAT family N-acetyltransferase n=1 Tax=Fretibacter rubidus TaxID=570162 RepID=UPI00352AFFFD
MSSNPVFSATILPSISAVSESAWDAQLPAVSHPFLSWRFLNALEESGSAAADTGWTPCHIWVTDGDDTAVGAAPLYAKTHSQGEYVFDHGWADALHRAGIEYYPKLQCSVPFTPATGPRLLSHTAEGKAAVLSAIMSLTEREGFSSGHMTFLEDADKDVAAAAGWLARQDRQFHFINRDYSSFDDFLTTLTSRKRKNIRKERKAAQDGVTIKRLSEDNLKPHHWDIFYQCYIDTGMRKWGRPYLTRDFFDRMQETMRDDICLVIAEMDDSPVAAALNYIGGEALYGRNWGTLIDKPFLHFELCYYQAIEEGIARGLSRVEAGAQGEHKLARGYEPVTTHSAHFITHPGLRGAVDDYLIRERRAVDHEVNILSKHTPFKKTSDKTGE